MTNPAEWKFDTKQIHSGIDRSGDINSSVALPIHQTTSYAFKDAKQAADRFALSDPGPIYTRLNNPTSDAVEQRIAALEGGTGALAVASGAGAITLSILNLAQAGDNIVASPSLYGGTIAALANNLPRYGIETRFVTNPYDPDEWKSLADERTVAFYGETIPNPKNDFFDIETIANAAHEIGVPLLIDNTVATPYLTRPIEWGADVVIHSATKYLGGHGTSILGFIVDGGNFDWGQDPDRFRSFNQPDPSYHGLVYKDLGNVAFVLKARAQGERDFGWAASPFNAFLVNLGIETLSLRLAKHVANAQKVAEYLEAHTGVASVAYAGLKSSPYYQYAQKYAPKGAGAVISFELENATREDGAKFADALQLHLNVANIGDVRSLVIHPASTTHSQANEDELRAAGVGPATIRLSVGIEDIDDILADLELGFKAVGK